MNTLSLVLFIVSNYFLSAKTGEKTLLLSPLFTNPLKLQFYKLALCDVNKGTSTALIPLPVFVCVDFTLLEDET